MLLTSSRSAPDHPLQSTNYTGRFKKLQVHLTAQMEEVWDRTAERQRGRCQGRSSPSRRREHRTVKVGEDSGYEQTVEIRGGGAIGRRILLGPFFVVRHARCRAFCVLPRGATIVSKPCCMHPGGPRLSPLRISPGGAL